MELPVLLIYNTITLVHLFKDWASWKTVLLGIGSFTLNFMLDESVQQMVINRLK